MRIKGILILFFSAGLSLAGLLFGSYDPLWEKLNTPDEYRETFSLGLAFLILLIGHTISILVANDEMERKTDLRATRLEDAISGSLSGVFGIRVFQTAEESASYIELKLKTARKVWNTRIPAEGYANYSDSEAAAYAKKMQPVIKRGVFYREIVGYQFADAASELQEWSDAQGIKANYRHKAWTEPPTAPFFNFIVIQDESGPKEVLFGWVITPFARFEQQCFSSSNDTLVQHFITIHELMMSRDENTEQ